MQLKVTRIDKDLPLPTYQTPGSVAFDISSRIDEIFEPGEIKTVPSNLIIQVPESHVLLIATRSSLAKRGLRLANSVGIIDQDYHGPQDEIQILLHNFSREQIAIKKNERIAQGLIMPIVRVGWKEVSEIKIESRGGLGSTGK